MKFVVSDHGNTFSDSQTPFINPRHHIEFDLDYRFEELQIFFKMSIAVPTTKEERLALIKDNLAEALNFEIIEKIIEEGGTPKIYWGMHNFQYITQLIQER